MRITEQQFNRALRTIKEYRLQVELDYQSSVRPILEITGETELIDLGICVRLWNVLAFGCRIRTVNELRIAQFSDIAKHRGFGKACEEELTEVFNQLGIEIK